MVPVDGGSCAALSFPPKPIILDHLGRNLIKIFVAKNRENLIQAALVSFPEALGTSRISLHVFIGEVMEFYLCLHAPFLPKQMSMFKQRPRSPSFIYGR